MSREKFEAWASDDGKFPLAIERTGDLYRLLATQNKWEVWQAAIASMQSERDQLAAQVADVVAENAALNQVRDMVIFIRDEDYDACPAKAQEVIRKLAVLRTPATDRFLAEQRAHGVEMVLELIAHTKDMLYADSVKATLSDFAAQLRNEVKG